MRGAKMGGFTARILCVLSVILSLQGCHRVTEQELKDSVVGSWEEVRGTNETLQFDANGTVLMQSPSENHDCVYDFPDTSHIRFNCAPPGAPARPQVWKVKLTSERLLISDGHEVGTYKRK